MFPQHLSVNARWGPPREAGCSLLRLQPSEWLGRHGRGNGPRDREATCRGPFHCWERSPGVHGAPRAPLAQPSNEIRRERSRHMTFRFHVRLTQRAEAADGKGTLQGFHPHSGWQDPYPARGPGSYAQRGAWSGTGMGVGGVASPGLGADTVSAWRHLAEFSADSGHALGSQATTVTAEMTVPRLCVPSRQDPQEGQKPPPHSRKVRWPSWSQAAGSEQRSEPRRLQPALMGRTGRFRTGPSVREPPTGGSRANGAEGNGDMGHSSGETGRLSGVLWVWGCLRPGQAGYRS